MYKKLLILTCFLGMITSLSAQTLAPGDIAIIGTNYDVFPYEMTIVNLAPIPANTVIRITDYGYDETTGTFGTTSVSNTSEGSITWTTTALAAGTVTKLTISGGATPVVTGLPGTVTVTGWSNATATNCPVPAGGDNWFIFQGNSPTSINNFIFAWTNTFSATFNAINQPAGQFIVPGSGAPNNNNSYLPPSLTLGSTAIALNRDPSNGGYHGDNNVYTGIFIGTKAQILSEIGNVSKWVRSETVAFNITPGAIGSSFPGINPIFILPNANPTDLDLSATSINENVAAGTTVGVLSSVDIDLGNTFTYSLVAGTGSTDNSAFTISGANLQINASPDFETKSSYSIRLRTADQGGLSFEKQFTINVNNLNEVPTDLALSATSINENVAAGTTVGVLSSVDVDAANTFTYSLVAGTGSTDNSAFTISGANLQINASPDFETKSSYSIRLRTADQGGLSFEKQFIINVNNLNEVPTDLGLSATAVNENVAAGTTVGVLSSVDVDAANTFTYSLVAGTGSTDNSAFTISGANLQINASPDFETKSSYSIRLRTADQGGLSFEKQFTINVNNLNEVPTDLALSATSINENVAAGTTVGVLSSVDVDAANTFTYSLVAGTGSTDNSAFTISGANLQINASPDFETKSSYAIRIRTADQGGLSFEKQFTINVNNLNEVPTDLGLSATAVNENVAAGTTVGVLSSVDVDAANTFTYSLVAGTGSTDNSAFTISGANLQINASPDFETKSSYSIRLRTADQGGLSFEKQFTINVNNLNEVPTDLALSATSINENVAAGTTVGVLSSVDVDAANTFTYSLVAGTGSTDNSAFTISGANLQINASPDFETKSSYAIRIRTADQGGLSFEKQFTINVNNLNEVPTDLALSATSINENVAAGTTVGVLSSVDVDAANTFTYSLVAGTGSTDNSAFTISGANLQINASPDFETKSSYSIRLRTADQGGLSFEKQFTINVNNLNEAPTNLSLSSTSINENVAAGTTVGVLSSVDVDAANTFTYSLVAGTGSTDNSAFTISGANLQINASPDFETKSSYAIRIRTADQGGLSFEKQFTINVNNLNEVPTDLALSATSINENVAAGTTVGVLSSVDVDAANTFTYSLVAGTGSTDNSAFTISGANLQINASPDFETKSSYSIRLRTADQGGLSFEKQFTINVNNLNEVPTDLALSATSINENVAAGTTVGVLSSVDVDAANTFTYSLVAGTGSTDNSAFTISGANLQINASPDFETKSSYAIRIRTADQGGLSFEKQFTINVNNLNEVPTDLALSATSINENVAAGTTVGVLSSVDVDAANTFTYSLVAGTGSTDNSAFTISGANLQINASPDFETKSSYSIRLRTADQGGLSFEKQFTINVNNLNEVPTDLALSATSINENVAAGTTVGVLSSVDVDAANTFTYSLVAGTGSTDNSAFTISGANLQINASPDFETKSSYSIRLRTADQGGLSFEKQFTINVNNLNEAPTNLSLSSTSINENVAANTTVGTLSSTDQDAGNTFTYTLVAGTGDTDNSAFSITGNSLRINASPDFETKSSYSIRIRTTDQNGLTFEKAITITVNDVCELTNTVTLASGVLTADQAGAIYQWIQCPATLLTGENGQSFTPTAVGSYAVVVTIGLCSVLSTCVNVTTLDNPDFEEKSKFVMYPNPNKGILNIESDHDADLNIVNQLGQTVKTEKVSSEVINSFNIESLADGVYFVNEKQGNKTITHKLILKK